MYYNRYDDNCEDKKYSSREKEKCCVRVTEYCCFPSYYTEEKNDKYEDKKHDCGCKNDYDYKKDCDCKKEPICREERKEKKKELIVVAVHYLGIGAGNKKGSLFDYLVHNLLVIH